MTKPIDFCRTCRFWNDDPDDPSRECAGFSAECRRYPPVQLPWEEGFGSFTGWPVTNKLAWCGEYEDRRCVHD